MRLGNRDRERMLLKALPPLLAGLDRDAVVDAVLALRAYGDDPRLCGPTVLLALTVLERETWIDVQLVGLSQRAIADRDGVTEGCITHRLARAERKRAAAIARRSPSALLATRGEAVAA